MNVYDQAHALAKSIKESDEYKQYQEAKKKLEEEEKAKEMLMEFRKFQYDVQMEQIASESKEVDREKADKLKKMYETINMNTIIKDYLAAEYRFGKMVADVSKILGDAIGLEEFEELTGTREPHENS